MLRLAFCGAVPLVFLLGAGGVAAQQASEVRTGTDAFGGWSEDRPGVMRHIRLEDLPLPEPEEAASNSPDSVAMPKDARPEVPEGFTVEMVTSGLDRPRVLRRAPNGDIFLAESGANAVRVYRLREGSAEPEAEEVFADKLNRPYGIAFYPPGDDPEWVYVANQDSVVRYPYENGDLVASGEPETVVSELPAGGHWTRDIAFSPDGATLFISVGSRSNVGERMSAEPPQGFIESHPPGAAWGNEARRAAVLAFDPDGGNERIFATGIRNCSGLAIHPETGLPWCATNERDGLGDDLPFEYVTSLEEGDFYGWPWFYIGANEDPRHAGARPDLADRVAVPDVLIQAHSAPLGIAFYDSDAFPAELRGDAFVTLHGSWNRGTRTGYKVVRIPFENGEPTGAYQDFITGFVISDDAVWGRPVGVAVASDGALLISEDGNGTIWRIAFQAGQT